jgi:beta-phosphoglucomutase
MPIRGVIFDFNGTLVNDTHLHNLAWREFFDRYKLPQPGEREIFLLHGKTNKDILSIIFHREMEADEVVKYGFEKEEVYRDLFRKKNIQLMPGAVDLFNWLRNKEIPFTIATASDKENVDFYFDFLNLSHYFYRNNVVFNDGTIPGKPDPTLFNMAIEQLEMSSDEVLIFEDSFNGIMAAENAKAGKIVIMDSHGEDYSRWNHDVITSFVGFDKSIFV